MRKVIVFVLVSLMLATVSYAREVSQLVFSQASSAVTSTPNLRIQVTPSTLARDKNEVPLQGSVLAPSMTYNYYLTKSIAFPITDSMVAVDVDVDQDTKMQINSETAYWLIRAESPISKVLR
jgi:hypothetical protein